MSLLCRFVGVVVFLLGAARERDGVREGDGSSALWLARLFAGFSGAAAVACVLVLGAGQAVADSCPNAAFRQGPSANLPDCRAYELVTPRLSNGWFPFVTGALDASHVVFSSLGAPGDPSADPFASGASYVAARTPSGWVSTPIDPPASQYSYADVIGSPLREQNGVSQDFGEALSGAVPVNAKPVDARLVLTRTDGSVAEIGPTVPPATVAAWQPSNGDNPTIANVLASPDLSHVFFTSQAGGTTTDWLWAGDTTTAAFSTQSLYEYAGTGNSAPTLVAVDDSGQLISQCGAGLGDAHIGGRSGTAAEAISSDGSKAFFTAWGAGVSGCVNPLRAPPVDELFARVDGTRTVAISEPAPADCSACQTAIPARADFQGASLDGSRVLFLTTQGLLPADTDTSTDLYMYDFNAPAGQKIIQVSAGGHGDVTPSTGADVQGVVRISQDGSHVYFVATGVLTTDPNQQGQVAHAGQDNLYVYERDAAFPAGRTGFVATLSGNDSSDWSQSQPGGGPETTPDGRYLLLPSTNDLTPDASGSGSQLYRYDAQTGQLVRVTIGEGGFNANGNTGDSYFDAAPPGSPGPGQAVSISDDGAYVFYSGSAALTPLALNDHPIDQFGDFAFNVYEWHDGNVYLLSDGQDTSNVFGGSGTVLVGASPSGSDVYLTSGDQLAASDGNSQKDLYDARIGGGFPAAQGAPTCSGDACQGPAGTQPPAATAATVTFTGPGNATAGPARSPARAKVLSRAVHGSTFLLRVGVPARGRVMITGAGIKTVRKSVAKGGTYRLRVTLTANQKQALKHKHKLKLKLRVSYAPTAGTPSSVSFSITDKA